MKHSIRCITKKTAVIIITIIMMITCVYAAAVSNDWTQLEIILKWFGPDGREYSVIAEPLYDCEGAFIANVGNAPLDALWLICSHPSHEYVFVPGNEELLTGVCDTGNSIDMAKGITIEAYENGIAEKFSLFISSTGLSEDIADATEENNEDMYPESQSTEQSDNRAEEPLPAESYDDQNEEYEDAEQYTEPYSDIYETPIYTETDEEPANTEQFEEPYEVLNEEPISNEFYEETQNTEQYDEPYETLNEEHINNEFYEESSNSEQYDEPYVVPNEEPVNDEFYEEPTNTEQYDEPNGVTNEGYINNGHYEEPAYDERYEEKYVYPNEEQTDAEPYEEPINTDAYNRNDNSEHYEESAYTETHIDPFYTDTYEDPSFLETDEDKRNITEETGADGFIAIGTEEDTEEQAADEEQIPVGMPVNRFGYTNKTNINYRSIPSKSGRAIGKIRNTRTYVYILCETYNQDGERWMKTLYNGTECYIMSEFVTMLGWNESEAYMATLSTPVPPYSITENDPENTDSNERFDPQGPNDLSDTYTEKGDPADTISEQTVSEDYSSIQDAEETNFTDPERTDDKGNEIPFADETKEEQPIYDAPIPVGELINRFGITNIANINCRKAPDKSGKALGQIKKAGTVVYLIRETANESGELWMNILFNGEECFVMSQYIEVMSREESEMYMSALNDPITPYTETTERVQDDRMSVDDDDVNEESTKDLYDTTTEEDRNEKATLNESDRYEEPETAADPAEPQTDIENKKTEDIVSADEEQQAAEKEAEIPTGELINRFGVTNTPNINRRKKPEKSGKAIGQIKKKGTKVYLIREVINNAGEKWMNILFNGEECFVVSEYITMMNRTDSENYMATLTTPVLPYSYEDVNGSAEQSIVSEEKTADTQETGSSETTSGNTVSETAETTTAVYTETPSDTPTEPPVSTPTGTPSATPTETTEVTPTGTPTVTPTATPTVTATDIPTETPTATPTQTPTAVPTKEPETSSDPEKLPAVTAYSGWAITVKRVDLMTGNNSTGESVMAILPAGTILYINRQTYDESGVLWDISTNLENLTGMVRDTEMRHISDEEAETLIQQWKTANATPTLTPVPESTEEPKQVTGYAVSIGDGVYVRNYPSSSSVITAELMANKIVYVTGQVYQDGNAWHEVLFDEEWGYIRADMLRMLSERETADYIKEVNATEEPAAERTPQPYDDDMMSSYGYVSAKTVNFRKEPKTSSARIRQLKQYAFCLVLGTENINNTIWYKVVYDGNTGYISGDYFKQMTVGELDEFLAGDDYIKGITANSKTGTDQVRDEADSYGVIIAAEDQKVNVWTNPNSGLNVSYKPFDPFATPEPIVTPETENTEEAETETPTEEPTTESTATILPDPLATNRTSYNTEDTETRNPIGAILLGGIAVTGIGGAGYAWYIHAQNKRRAAQRAAQRKAQQARQASGPIAQNKPNAVPAISATQTNRIRTGTYSEKNGTATPVPDDMRSTVSAQLKPYGKTMENPYGRYSSKTVHHYEENNTYTASFRPTAGEEKTERRSGRRSDRYSYGKTENDPEDND